MVIQNEIVEKEIKRCVRCIMPENYPEVTYDGQGICNYCRAFEVNWGSWIRSAEEQASSASKLQTIFDAAKCKNKPYDALLGISGGKDSSYMLYLCRKVYGLNLLTFTKDGGFLTDEAKMRIDKLVRAFDVAHIYLKDPLFLDLVKIFLRKTGNFCAPCELSTFNLSAMLAREYDIPLLILGTSSRTEAGAPKFLNPWDPWYFNKVVKGEPYKERISRSCYGSNYIIREGITQVIGKRRMVLLPDYVEWNEDKIRELFKRDFGFDFGGEHSDCWATGIAGYLYSKKCGGNHPQVAKYSLLIRSGEMTRSEALQHINEDIGNTAPPYLERFLRVVGMTQQEFEAASEKSPGPYLSGISQVFNKMRKRIRRQAA